MTDYSAANTEYAHKIVGSMKTVFKKLPDTIGYKSLFKKYREYILNQRAAIYHATELLPILAALIVIVVERDLDHAHKMAEMRNQHIQEINKLREEMEQLRREIKCLPSHE
jgi:hypothetical protein